MIPLVVVSALVAFLWIAWATDQAFERAQARARCFRAGIGGLSLDARIFIEMITGSADAIDELETAAESDPRLLDYSPRVPWHK